MNYEPRSLAKAARLRYVSARTRGIRRLRCGRGFTYRTAGKVKLAPHLARIRCLAIPPAWRDVWICSDPRGHLQATGVDARGRLQYRYHADWMAICDSAKFHHVSAFGQNLPVIRRRVARDLAQSGLPRSKVLATIVRLLERSLIRVGNEEYARDNASFGLTTLRKRHVQLTGGGNVQFRFVGKSSIDHDIDLFAPAVAAVIRACQRLPGRDLFQYLDGDDQVRDVTAGDVNAYLAEVAQVPVTAKDFRTWGATVLFHQAFLGRPAKGSSRELAKHLRSALQSVAAALGNTVAVCRKSYVHPALAEHYLAGDLKPVAWLPPALPWRSLWRSTSEPPSGGSSVGRADSMARTTKGSVGQSASSWVRQACLET